MIEFNKINALKRQYKLNAIELDRVLYVLNTLVNDGTIDEIKKAEVLQELGIQDIPLEILKKIKIEEMRKKCNDIILSGFNSVCLGTEKQFDSNYTDQSTIQGLVQAAMLIKQGLSTEILKWKGSGELECYEFTPDQIIQLGFDLKKHIETNIDRFNALRIYILDENRIIDDVETLAWDSQIS